MNKKTFIFFPLEFGIAHITRSLAIAEVLKQKGHRVIFALPKRKQSFAAHSNLEVVEISGYGDKEDIGFVNHLKNLPFMLLLAKEVQQLLVHYRPDCVIADFYPAALAASIHMNIPVIHLSGGAGVPYEYVLPMPGIPKVVKTFLNPILNQLILFGKRPYLQTLTKVINELGTHIDTATVFKTMYYIVPESPQYLPLLSKSIKIHYVGPLFWNGFEKNSPEWLQKIKSTGKTVYISFGGTGLDRDKLIHLSTTLIERGYTVIVSTSHIAKPEDFPSHPRLFVASYLPGFEVCKKVDAVICHGGYGTISQAVISGKPVIMIPFNPDQFIHSLRFHELGLGRVVFQATLIEFLKFFRIDILAFQEAGRNTPISTIIKALEDVLKHKEQYLRSIAYYNKHFFQKDGHIKASNIIEDLGEYLQLLSQSIPIKREATQE